MQAKSEAEIKLQVKIILLERQVKLLKAQLEAANEILKKERKSASG